MSNAVIDNPLVQVYEGNALTTLKTLAEGSVDCCVTSPPYWGLRDYGHPQQMGLESSPFEYIEKMAAVFDEVRRVLKPSGTCWIVIGDSYAGGKARRTGQDYGTSPTNTLTRWSPNTGAQLPQTAFEADCGAIKPKDLCGIPWRLAFALQERGWYLRQDIIWAKPNPMPESVTDRCTRSHEYVFLMAKAARYHFDSDAIAFRGVDAVGTNRGGSLSRNSEMAAYEWRKKSAGEDHHGAPYEAKELVNCRDVWTLTSEPFPDAHFATFPTKLVELCIKAGCPPDGVVLDPFGGCGTTGEVAVKLGRRAVLIELNPDYIEMIRKNLGLFAMAQAVGVSV